jgi:transposase
VDAGGCQADEGGLEAQRREGGNLRAPARSGSRALALVVAPAGAGAAGEPPGDAGKVCAGSPGGAGGCGAEPPGEGPCTGGRSPGGAGGIKVVDLSGLREELKRLLDEGAHDSLLELVLGLLEKMMKENTQLAFRLQAALRQAYRKKSERLSPDQLALFLEQVVSPEATANEGSSNGEQSPSAPLPQASESPKQEEKPAGRQPKSSPKRPRKKSFPDTLRREVRFIPVPQDERVCGQRGATKQAMGYEVRETWEFKPAEFFIIEERLEKCVCKTCQEGVVTAVGTSKPIEGGRPGPGLLAQIVTSKFADGCPLYRQSQIYRRSGIELSP